MNTFASREARASELIGSYAVKTAGGIMIPSQRRVLDGWFYANAESILFLADGPLIGLSVSFPGLLDATTVLWRITERPAHRLTAPMLTPNGIIRFDDGIEIVGAKKPMKAVSALLTTNP